MKKINIKNVLVALILTLAGSSFAATATLTPTTYDYGSVTIGSSSTQVFTLTNTNGLTTLTISSATVAAPFVKTVDNCTGNSAMSTLAATCTIEVAYVPTAITTSISTLTVVTNATDGTNKISTIQGAGVTGPTVTASLTPTSYAFGNVTLGSTSAATFTVENTGGSINLTIASATVAAPFTKTADNCTGASLPLNGTCTIEVSFVPTAITTSNSTLTVVTNATNGTTKISTLSGNGVTGPSVTGSLTPGTANFGSVTLGSSSTQIFTLENTGGTANLTITSATASAAPFIKTADTCTGATLTLSGTCTVEVTFFPTTAAISFGTLTFVTNATNGSNKIASLIGTGVVGPTVTATLTPSTFNFGNVSVGSLSATTLTLENTGGTNNLTIASAAVSAAPFIKTADTCTGATLALSQTCTIEVSYFPTTATPSATVLTVVTNATNGSNKITSLTGTGILGGSATGSISPTTYNYPDVVLGNSSSHTFTIENTGGSGNLNITSMAVTAGTPFFLNSDTCTGTSLALNATCTVNVVFSPITAGTFAGTLTAATNASNGTNKIASFNGSTASAGTIGFSSETYQFNNDVENAVIYVTRSGGSVGSASVNYTTVSGTASEIAGDYEDKSGTLTWTNGDTSPKTISVKILDQAFDDESRFFSVVLSPDSGNASLGTSTATVEIFDYRQTIKADTEGTNIENNGGCQSNGSSLWMMLVAMVLLLGIQRRKITQ
jgi:hypothetical protein